MMPTAIYPDKEKVSLPERIHADRFEPVDPPDALVENLTPRQQEILKLLARGFNYREIGEELGISYFTVRAHLHTVYQKLKVKSRALAVIKFQQATTQQPN